MEDYMWSEEFERQFVKLSKDSDMYKKLLPYKVMKDMILEQLKDLENDEICL